MTTKELDIEKVIEMIFEGLSFRKMAEKLKIPLSTFHDYTTSSEHSARVRAALEYSAQTFEDMGEECLLKAKGTLPEIQRARELAQHYRWKASKRNPRRYGEKLDLTTLGNSILPPPQWLNPDEPKAQ